MSETVHYKGVLKIVERYDNETIEDQCKRLLQAEELPSYYDSYKEFYLDEYYDTAVIHKDIIYRAEKEEIDPYRDIYNAKKIGDNEIEFEVKYYDGGCSFSEAIIDAIKNMKYNETPDD